MYCEETREVKGHAFGRNQWLMEIGEPQRGQGVPYLNGREFAIHRYWNWRIGGRTHGVKERAMSLKVSSPGKEASRSRWESESSRGELLDARAL